MAEKPLIQKPMPSGPRISLVRIGTRGSKLALTQTGIFAARLKAAFPSIEIEIVEIKTSGDTKQGTGLASQSDKRDWIHELELALLEGSIDLAIHSAKDVPAVISDRTVLIPVLERENPYDAFVGKKISADARLRFEDLPRGATIGTASLRRLAQLTIMRPDLHIVEVRGNVTTRLQKLEESTELMGIVLAAAGLNRLGLTKLNFENLPSPECLPAVNQGILTAHVRADQNELVKLLQEHFVAESCNREFLAERACVKLLDADCKSAVAIFACYSGSHNTKAEISLHAKVLLPDGSKLIEERFEDSSHNAEQLGRKVAERLITRGALELLAESHHFIRK